MSSFPSWFRDWFKPLPLEEEEEEEEVKRSCLPPPQMLVPLVVLPSSLVCWLAPQWKK